MRDGSTTLAQSPDDDPRPIPRQLLLPRHVDRADPTRPSIGLLVGMGGVGKTALAVHWAHRAVDRFPDGRLFLDMRGYSPGGSPVAPGDALTALLPAFGVDITRMPVDVDSRAALFRSLTARRRFLLVLDNVAVAEQVRPLLPATRSCRLTAPACSGCSVCTPVPWCPWRRPRRWRTSRGPRWRGGSTISKAGTWWTRPVPSASRCPR